MSPLLVSHPIGGPRANRSSFRRTICRRTTQPCVSSGKAANIEALPQVCFPNRNNVYGVLAVERRRKEGRNNKSWHTSWGPPFAVTQIYPCVGNGFKDRREQCKRETRRAAAEVFLRLLEFLNPERVSSVISSDVWTLAER